MELVGFGHGQSFLVGVDDDQQVRCGPHFTNTAKRRLQFCLFAFQTQTLFLGQAFGAGLELLVDFLETGDRVGNSLPVGQRAAEPAVVHVVLSRTLGCFCNRFLRLTLGADEQDAAALGDGFAHRVQRSVEQRNGLRQVNDVDATALTIDKLVHARVPTVCLVAKMYACFEQLAQ